MLSLLFPLCQSERSATTIQQLAPESQAGQANIDSTTALTPTHNEKFLNDRLFKRKKARLTAKTGDKGKTKDADKPFLIFDPLLDKPKKEKAAKPLTRSEMEERMRFRKSGWSLSPFSHLESHRAHTADQTLVSSSNNILKIAKALHGS